MTLFLSLVIDMYQEVVSFFYFFSHFA